MVWRQDILDRLLFVGALWIMSIRSRATPDTPGRHRRSISVDLEGISGEELGAIAAVTVDPKAGGEVSGQVTIYARGGALRRRRLKAV
jgi:hypothetical protein